MSVDDLLARLTAGLAEDERIAKDAFLLAMGADWHYDTAEYAAAGHGWVHNSQGVVLTADDNRRGAVMFTVGAHMAHFDPARAWRQVEATRSIVGLHHLVTDQELDKLGEQDRLRIEVMRTTLEDVIEKLAGIYTEPAGDVEYDVDAGLAEFRRRHGLPAAEPTEEPSNE